MRAKAPASAQISHAGEEKEGVGSVDAQVQPAKISLSILLQARGPAPQPACVPLSGVYDPIHPHLTHAQELELKPGYFASNRTSTSPL